MLETISGHAPFGGPEPCPAGQGRYGIDDQMRPQEAMLPGMAVSRMDTTSNANNRSIYKFGNALARPEFYGVLTTKGTAPQLTVNASSTNADTVSVLYAGYAPVLLAPGQTVKPGQYLEPIVGGSYQAMFRVMSAGVSHIVARDYADNSGGTEGIWVGADIFGGRSGSGLLGVVGPSANLTGTTSETAYGLAAAATVTIPAYSLRVGSRLRITGAVLSNNIAAGNNTVKGYVNGIGSSALFTAAATTFAASDVVDFSVEVYINAASGSNNASLSGFVSAGTPGTATARAIPGLATIDLTANQVITIANTPNNNADSSKLLFLSVEKVA